MDISSCCGAPIETVYQSDTTNFSDDEYELRVPVKVCSKCGSGISKQSSPRERIQHEPEEK